MEVENTMILRERVRKEYDYKSVLLFFVLTYFILDLSMWMMDNCLINYILDNYGFNLEHSLL